MFGISGFEFLIIAGFILIIFGPEKLPEMARTFGRAMNQFNRAKEDMEAVIRAEMHTGNKPATTGLPGTPEHPLEGIKERVAASAPTTFEDDDEDEEDEE